MSAVANVVLVERSGPNFAQPDIIFALARDCQGWTVKEQKERIRRYIEADLQNAVTPIGAGCGFCPLTDDGIATVIA